MSFLRWFLPSVLPAAIAALGIYKSDRNREPWPLVALTFTLGALGYGVAYFIERAAMRWTGLDLRTAVAGDAGALLFVFAVVAPFRELAKVAACWPAFRSQHFDEPYDGIVYASASALGAAALENALMLRGNPVGAIWIVRALVALPAHLFFACLWGYALGRVKRTRTPGPMFGFAWLLATTSHGLYIHFVYGRSPGALFAVAPLLVVMGLVAALAARDAAVRGDRLSRTSVVRLSRLSLESIPHAPSLQEMRDALRPANQPIRIRWIVAGAFVTMGTMMVGVAAAVLFARWGRVDFAAVAEHDLTTSAPLALLGAGLLAGFPTSGFLIARASGASTLLEPVLAAALAIVIVMVLLGVAAPVALIFGVSFSPVALIFACVGAWVGRAPPSAAQ